MKRFYLFILLLNLTLINSFGQNSGIKSDSLLIDYLQGSKQLFPYQVVSSYPEEFLLKQMEKSLVSEEKKIRRKCYNLIYYIGLTTQIDKNRQNAIHLLFQAVKDPAHEIRIKYSEALSRFKKSDFSKTTIEEIRTITDTVNNLQRTVIQLMGLLNLPDALKKVQNKFGTTPPSRKKGIRYFHTPEWALHLAYARMGRPEHIQYVVDRVQQEPKQNVAIFYLKDLAFIRQKEATDIIIEYFLGDERLPPMDGGAQERCANRAMWHLAKIIKDFPYEYTDAPMYRRHEIEAARTWLRANRHQLEYNMDTF